MKRAILLCLLLCLARSNAYRRQAHQGPRIPRFLAFQENKVVEYDPVTGSSKVVQSRTDALTAFDVSFERDWLFYLDEKDYMIKASAINNSQDTRELLEFSEPNNLAVDWISEKLYWITEIGRIEVCNFDGSIWTVLVFEQSDKKLRSLVLDPLRGYMYWVNVDTTKLERAWMDGSHREFLVEEDYSAQALYFTIHLSTGHIYLAEGSPNKDERQIVVINPETKERIIFLKATVFWLQIHQNYLYVYHEGNGDPDKPKEVFSRCAIDIGTCILEDIPLKNPPALFLLDHTLILEPTIQPRWLKDGMQRRDSCDPRKTGCSHLCLLRPIFPGQPRFSCACPAGIRMHDDNKTCDKGLRYVLLFAKGEDIRYMSLDINKSVHIPIGVRQVERAVALDFDPKDKFIYWTDQDLQKIKRAHLNGSGESDIIVGEVESSDGIAVDWVARNLYWTEASADRIEVSRLDGSSRRTLISEDLKNPRAIVLDPAKGFMYWSDWNDHRANNSKIEKAYLDGSGRTVLIARSLGWPNGLAIDRERNLIYWVDAKLKVLEVASSIDGSGRRVITADGEISKLPFGLSLLGNWLYWSDNWERSISRIRVDQKYGQKISTSDAIDVKDVKAVDLESPPKGYNQCARHNGGCSHLCLYRPVNNRVCACPTGWELKSDRTTCYEASGFILYTKHHLNDVMRVSLNSDPMNQFPLRLRNATGPNIIEYDYASEHIYWTDVSRDCRGSSGCSKNFIMRAFMNGSKEEIVLSTGEKDIEGIAVDWIAKNIYWSHWSREETGYIEVARLSGYSRKILIWRNTKPRTIVVNPLDGYFYWAEWSLPPTIQRAELDGTHRTDFISCKHRVYAMTMDYPSKRLYWTEGTDHEGFRIKSSDLNGGSIRLIREQTEQLGYYPPAFTPLTHYRDSLYTYSQQDRAVQVISKNNGSHFRYLHKGFAGLDAVFGMKVVDSQEQRGTNPCESGNPCHHLCFAVPTHNRDQGTQRKCGCPNHYELSDHNDGECIGPRYFLLVAEKSRIYRFKLKPEEHIRDTLLADEPEIALPISNLHQVTSLQYDYQNKILYFIDVLPEKRNARALFFAKEEIDRMAAEEVSMKTISKCDPRDLSVDQSTGQLFVACWGSQRIELLRYSSSSSDLIHVGTVFKLSGFSPRYVSASSEARKLVFVDEPVNSGNPSRVILCDFDGRHCSSRKLEAESPRKALIAGEYVVWTDPSHIYRMHVHDFATETAEPKSIKSNAVYITEFKPRILIASGSSNALDSVNLEIFESKLDEKMMRSPMLALHAVSYGTVVSASCRKGHCKNYEQCIITPSKYTECGCPRVPRGSENPYPDNVANSPRDLRSCQSSIDCKQWEFACVNGVECIHYHQICDGKPDCSDGSDEELICSRFGQDPEKWPCRDGNKQVTREQRCDGRRNCEDGSDESTCRCSRDANGGLSAFFDCTFKKGVRKGEITLDPNDNPICIDSKKFCDGVFDCKEGEDEHSCLPHGQHPTPTEKKENGNESNNVVYIAVGIIVGLFVLFLAICFFLKRRETRGRQDVPVHNFNVNASVVVTQTQGSNSGTASTALNLNYSLPNTRFPIGPVPPGGSTGTFNGGSLYYPRADLTGKSSSSAEAEKYPPNNFESPGAPPNSEANVSLSLPSASGVQVYFKSSSGEKGKTGRSRHRQGHAQWSRYNDQEECGPFLATSTPPPPYHEAARDSNECNIQGPSFRNPSAMSSTTSSEVMPGARHHRNRRRPSDSTRRKKGSRSQPRKRTHRYHRTIHEAPPPSPATERSFAASRTDREASFCDSEGSDDSYLNPPPSPENLQSSGHSSISP